MLWRPKTMKENKTGDAPFPLISLGIRPILRPRGTGTSLIIQVTAERGERTKITWAASPNKYSHRCFGKIRKIFERTGVLLTHDEITYLCEYLWKCQNADEFYSRMGLMSTDELKEWARKARRKKNGIMSEEALETLYA